jgi:integrase
MTTKVIFKKDSQGHPRLSAKGETTLYIRYQHNSKTADFQACKVNPEVLELINRNGRIDLIAPYLKARSKGRLEAIENIDLVIASVKSAVNRLLAKGIDPITNFVKKEFESGFNHSTEEYELPLLVDVFEDYLLSRHTSGISSNTIRQYKSTLNHIKNFHKAAGLQYAINQVDLNYYDDLIFFLRNTHKGIKKDSTIGKNVKTLKGMLNWARSRGFSIHSDIDNKEFRVFKSKKKVFYLTEEEVNALIDYDLSKHERLKRIRDRFVFNCYVGLRVGDLNRLDVKHIVTVNKGDIEVKVIELKTEKQRKRALIPLKPIPLMILEKNDFQLPRISDQKYNEYLKDLFKLAEIKREIEVEPGDFQPLSSLVTSHLAIKTFITLCHKWGISTKHVAVITGKTEKVINDHYYSVSDQDIIDVMLF